MKSLNGNAALMLIAGALLAQATPVMAQDGPDERAFSARFLPDVRATVPDATVTSVPGDPLQLSIERDDAEGPFVVNLHRMFKLCQRLEQAECDDQVRGFISAITRPDDLPRAENLRIIVRNAEYWAQTTQMMAQADTQPLYRQLGEDLYALLALDSPDRIAVISQSTLEELELEPDAAWERAAQQTFALLGPFPSSLELLRQPQLIEGPDYAGTILFALAEWEALSADVGRELLVAAPSDQLVFIAMVRDGEELDTVSRLIAEDCELSPRCLSPHTYRLRDGKWVIAK